MKLIILGTGNAMVTKCYNTCFAIEDNGAFFLVDAGGGNTIISQLQDAKIDITNIHDIFVTHKHMDHLLGIIWVIRAIAQSMTKGDYQGSANIYSHTEVLEIIRYLSSGMLQSKHAALVEERIKFIEVKDGESFMAVGHECSAFDIHSTKDTQFGFTMYYGEGSEKYEGGKKAAQNSFLKRLTCCGDEPYNEYEYGYAVNSDWLLHEAFCLQGEADIFKPYEKHHSTVKDACELAERLNIKNLVLYHTEDKNILNRKKMYMEEGKKFYGGNLYVPEDLEVIQID